MARRYHLLSFLENDKTDALFTHARNMKGDEPNFNRVAALMVRQNHYITQRCQDCLLPALENAKAARQKIQDFIQAEYGHDRILAAALSSIPSSDPQVVPESRALMDLLKFAAQRNFLAFAMIVDFFERSSYQESDAFADVLEHGGLSTAAKQINRHKDINDGGEHENFALGFLAFMAPVKKDYAEEALRLAEVTSNAMNLLSAGILSGLA